MSSSGSPKISVISACYNHGKYVSEMIDSVLRQSFQDFEIIIVNDGSTDDTQAILDSISHSKIHVIHSDHRGPSHARNLAMKHTGAEIILNLDADDKISSDLLEKAFRVFNDNPNAGIVYSECEYFGARHGRMKSATYSLRRMLSGNMIISNAFFRKEDWENTGGYSEDFNYGLEDWDFWLNIIKLGKNIVKIHDSAVYYRKYKPESLSRSGDLNNDRQKTVESLKLIFTRHKNLYLLYPYLFKKFSAYDDTLLDETRFNNWRRTNAFIIKNKLSNLIR